MDYAILLVTDLLNDLRHDMYTTVALGLAYSSLIIYSVLPDPNDDFIPTNFLSYGIVTSKYLLSYMWALVRCCLGMLSMTSIFYWIVLPYYVSTFRITLSPLSDDVDL